MCMSVIMTRIQIGNKTFQDIVSYHFVSCLVLFCDILYEISCLMYNHVFMWVRELTRSHMRYLLGFCEILYEICLEFFEISYKISFGVLQDLV